MSSLSGRSTVLLFGDTSICPGFVSAAVSPPAFGSPFSLACEPAAETGSVSFACSLGTTIWLSFASASCNATSAFFRSSTSACRSSTSAANLASRSATCSYYTRVSDERLQKRTVIAQLATAVPKSCKSEKLWNRFSADSFFTGNVNTT